MRFLTFISVKTTEKSKGEQTFLFIRSLDMFDSMSLLTVWMVIAVGIFVTSAAFFSFTGNRDAFHVHPTPQMCTASKLFRQFTLWKNSGRGAVSTNRSASNLGYAVGHVYWENNEGCHLEACQVANRKGKPGNILDFFQSKIESLKIFSRFVFSLQFGATRVS